MTLYDVDLILGLLIGFNYLIRLFTLGSGVKGHAQRVRYAPYLLIDSATPCILLTLYFILSQAKTKAYIENIIY